MRDEDVGYALAWVLAVSLAVGLAVVVLSGRLAQWLGAPGVGWLLVSAGVLIPLQALSNLPASLMQRNFDNKRLQFIQTAAYLAGYGVVGIALACMGMGAWSLILAFALQTFLVLVACYACVRHTVRPRWQGDGRLRRFGLSISATNLTNWALENVDRVLISRIWGTVALGEYAAAANLSRAPVNLMINSAQSVAFASASRLQNDAIRIRRGYLGALSLVLLLVCPPFAVMSVCGPEVVALLYGERWHGAGPLFSAFCAAVPALAVLAVTGPVLRGLGMPNVELASQAFVLLALVGGMLAMSGHPLATVVWLVPALMLVRAALSAWALARRIELPPRKLAHALLAGLVCGMAAALVAWALHPLTSGTAWLLASGGAAAVAVALVCRLSRGRLIVEELRELLLSRAGGSAMAARLCRFLALRTPGEAA